MEFRRVLFRSLSKIHNGHNCQNCECHGGSYPSKGAESVNPKVFNKKRCFITLLLLFSGWVQAELVTEEIQYEVDGESFTGYLAYDDRSEGQRTGILLVREWWEIGRAHVCT